MGTTSQDKTQTTYKDKLSKVYKQIKKSLSEQCDEISKIESKKFLCYNIPAPKTLFIKLFRFCVILIIIGIWWCALYFSIMNAFSLEAAQQYMFPGGFVFTFFLLVLLATLGGYIGEIFLFLPHLVGMIVVGIILRNIHPSILSGLGEDDKWGSYARSLALTTILIKAGLGLDVKSLFKMGIPTLVLTVMPCIIESVTIMVVSYFAFGLPWIWGLMCGFVLGAVSPAIVVPSLLALQEEGYGVKKGIPTMVIAAAGLDDIFAITGFGVCLGIAFQTDTSLIMQILHGPIEIIGGIGSGIILGLLCWPLMWTNTLLKTAVVFGLGIITTFGATEIGYSGAGPLCAMTMGCVAANIWDEESTNEVTKAVGIIWNIVQPVLFGSIGALIVFSDLTGELVGIAIGVIAVGLVTRTITAIFSVVRAGLNTKEKVFVGIAWLPKATVQAALGGIALDHARNLGLVKEVKYGEIILTLAVLSILITAPLGAYLIKLTGKRLLTTNKKQQEKVTGKQFPVSESRDVLIKKSESGTIMRVDSIELSDLRDEDFRDEDYRHSGMRRSRTEHSDMEHLPDLKHSDLDHIDIRHSDIGHFDIKHPDIKQSDIKHSDVKDSDIGHSDIRESDVKGSDMSSSERAEDIIK